MKIVLSQKQSVELKAAVKNKFDVVVGAPEWIVDGAVSLVVAEDKLSAVLSSGLDLGVGKLALSFAGLEPLVVDLEVVAAPAVKIELTAGEPKDI